MSIARCPRCNVPLLDEEAAAPACPACGHALREGPAPDGLPVAAVEAPPGRPWLLIGAVVLLSGAVLVLSLLLALPRPTEDELSPAPEAPEQGALASQRDRAVARARKERERHEKLSREVKRLQSELGKRKDAEKNLADSQEKLKAALAELKATKAALEEQRELVKAAEGATRIDNPDGDYTVKALNAGDEVRLVGKVGTLRITHLSGGTLDASKLRARNVLFEQPVNNRSVVTVCAPGGSVRLAGINLGKVEIIAPGGRAECHAPLNGESSLKVLARDVRLYGELNGSVKAHVTLTSGGSLKFKLLQGSSQLIWKKEKPTDAGPSITRGQIRPGAKFEDE